MNNFCPGDSESDYVYEYEDGDGNKFITDGVSVPKDTYIEVRRYEENAK
jgi:hypothetical protein